ncbi:liver-expressed antimicrobial peptide 2 [Carlito syrichta]|uniref:Liver-expressed antimicrobial peptide 2 n=1 Tax=Carlito syrichta TaxID=1868482 RepID=A0A1U7TFE6_CARSF|nr:liver-expressed antimicrobial peptide 2 [Carlito syrichta]
MWHLKLWATLTIFLLLLDQVDGSPIPEMSSPKRRPRRMTPFWRGVSLRPIGASCQDDSECITRLCRKRRCSLSVVQE